MIFRRLNQGTPTRLGSGLPMYPELSSVAHRRSDMANVQYWPLVCPQTSGIPFQFSVTASGVTQWRAVHRFGSLPDVVLSAGLLTTECYEGSKLLITYNGGAFSLGNGIWQFALTLDTGTTIWSDEFHACSDRAGKSILVKWKDSKEWLGGIYYGGGYENKMWIDTEFARTRGEFFEETVDDGYGRKLPVYSRLEEIYGFDVLSTDSMVNILYSIQMHDTVSISGPGLGATPVQEGSFRVEDTGERSNALAVMEVSFKVDAAEATTIDEPLFEIGTC